MEPASVWWEEVGSVRFPADEFKRMFHMSPITFEMLCRELMLPIAIGEFPRYSPISVRNQRVAVCIWHLASGEPLHQVAVRFGLEIHTCQKIILDVCIAIKDFLLQKYVVWPKSPSAVAIATQFEASYGIPHIIGAIYNTHIPIITPTVNPTDYDKHRLIGHTRKPSYSIRAQVVVDDVGCFTDFSIGHQGSLSDEDVLLASFLNKNCSRSIQAQGMWLVGGSSYTVKDWILTPYTNRNLSRGQRLFNEKVMGVRVVVKDAIMRLKARWKFLQKPSNVNLPDLPIMVGICCVLHNICERHGDTLDPQLTFDHVEDEMPVVEPVHSDAALAVRDNIANDLIKREKSIRISSSL